MESRDKKASPNTPATPEQPDLDRRLLIKGALTSAAALGAFAPKVQALDLKTTFLSPVSISTTVAVKTACEQRVTVVSGNCTGDFANGNVLCIQCSQFGHCIECPDTLNVGGGCRIKLTPVSGAKCDCTGDGYRFTGNCAG